VIRDGRHGAVPYAPGMPRPGVDGPVGVHVVDVAALGHQPQRLGAIDRAALGEVRDRVDLPGRAGLAGQAALPDDTQQPVGVLLADVPAAQASRASGSRRRSTSTASTSVSSWLPSAAIGAVVV
jgi:hypothetical protein